MTRRPQPVARAARRIARDADPARRRRLIAAVHAAARARGLDDETRRDFQRRVTGRESCRDMTVDDLHRLLDALNGRARAGEDRRPLLSKLGAICRALDLPWPEYVMGISRQMFGPRAPARVEWHTPEQLRKLVAALAIHQARREGETDEPHHR